jgi:beta-xylosidase
VRYRIRQRVLNTHSGSALQRWIDLGATDSLSRDDLEYLSQTSVPNVLLQEKEADKGTLRISFRMEANEMRAIHITRA